MSTLNISGLRIGHHYVYKYGSNSLPALNGRHSAYFENGFYTFPCYIYFLTIHTPHDITKTGDI